MFLVDPGIGCLLCLPFVWKHHFHVTFSIFCILSLLCLVPHRENSLYSLGDSLFSDGYLHDVYNSGLRRLTSKAKTEYCKGWIEFEYMKHIRAIAEESPLPFEDIMFHSQCPDAWDKHPPMVSSSCSIVQQDFLD